MFLILWSIGPYVEPSCRGVESTRKQGDISPIVVGTNHKTGTMLAKHLLFMFGRVRSAPVLEEASSIRRAPWMPADQRLPLAYDFIVDRHMSTVVLYKLGIFDRDMGTVNSYGARARVVHIMREFFNPPLSVSKFLFSVKSLFCL